MDSMSLIYAAIVAGLSLLGLTKFQAWRNGKNQVELMRLRAEKETHDLNRDINEAIDQDKKYEEERNNLRDDF